MLQDIKRSIGENFSDDYRRYITLQNKIRDDMEHDRSKFTERLQGVEMSLFIENVFEVTSSSVAKNFKNEGIDEMVKNIMERKNMLEAMDQANEEEYNNHMSNFIAIVSDPGRGDSKFNSVF